MDINDIYVSIIIIKLLDKDITKSSPTKWHCINFLKEISTLILSDEIELCGLRCF